MDQSYEQILSDLDRKIEKLFTKDERIQYLTFKAFSKTKKNVKDLFLSKSKVFMLIFRKPANDSCGDKPTPVRDISAPVLDGLFPLHLAVLTSCPALVDYLITQCGAKPNVKCVDANSPFHGMTPLEMALHIMSKLIPWTPQLSFAQFFSKFREAKPMLLLKNLDNLVFRSSGVRDLIFKHTLQGKVTELAALLTATSVYDNTLSSMHLPTATIPAEHNLGVPMMLRMFVATRISSLIREEILLSGTPNTRDKCEKCSTDLSKLRTIMKLLLSADRGELVISYHRKLALSVEDTYDSSKGLQDKSCANMYLKPDIFYREPSLVQPSGFFNTLTPPGYGDSVRNYDGLDSRNSFALTEVIFRELNGRKFEELSYGDTCLFRANIGHSIRTKFIQANTLMELSPPNSPASKSTFNKVRTLSTAAALTICAPCYRSGTRTSAWSEQVVARKLLSLVYVIKKGRV